MKLKFIKFFIKWIATNLSIPFWVIGHVHLSMNIYEDIHELIASFAMNIIVATGFLIEWKEKSSKKRKNQ
jgi:hypothetical protein